MKATRAEMIRLVSAVAQGRDSGLSDVRIAEAAIAELVNTESKEQRPHESADHPPPLRIQYLGGSIAPMVEAVAEAYQVPRDLAALGALATLSAAGLKRFVVRIRPGWREHLALYVAPVLEPGERKTAALKAVAGPLFELEATRARELEPLIRESQRAHADAAARVAALAKKAASAIKGGAAIEEALRDAREKLDALGDPVRAPRWFADDATPEALGRRLFENDGRMAIFASEGGIFETLAGRYSNGTPNLDLVLKGWDGAEPWIYDRVGLQLRVAEPLLTMCMFVQPDVLTALADKPGFRGRGLVGRFVYALPASRLGSRAVDPAPVPGAVSQAWRSTVERIALLQEQRSESGDLVPAEIPLSQAALSALLAYLAEVEGRLASDGDLRPYSDWAGKHVGTVARIAGLLHLADGDGREVRPIPRDTVQRAIAFGRGLVPHAVAAINRMGGGPTGSTPDKRKLVAYVVAHQGCTSRDVAQGGPKLYRGEGGTERARQDLDSLAADDGPLRREQGPRTVRYYPRRSAHGDGDTTGPRGPRNGKGVAVAGPIGAKEDSDEPFGPAPTDDSPFGAPAADVPEAPLGTRQNGEGAGWTSQVL